MFIEEHGDLSQRALRASPVLSVFLVARYHHRLQLLVRDGASHGRIGDSRSSSLKPQYWLVAYERLINHE